MNLINGSLPAVLAIIATPTESLLRGLAAQSETAETTTAPSIDDQIKDLDKQIQLLQKQLAKKQAENELKAGTSATDTTQIDDHTNVLAKKEAQIQAQKKLLTAPLPTSEVKTLEGKLSIDEKVSAEAEMLSHRSLKSATSQIAQQLQREKPTTLLIYNASDIAVIQAYRLFMAQLKALSARYGATAGQTKGKRVRRGSRDGARNGRDHAALHR